MIIKCFCDKCQERTKHVSTEEREPHGEKFERLTCTKCNQAHTIQIL